MNIGYKNHWYRRNRPFWFAAQMGSQFDMDGISAIMVSEFQNCCTGKLNENHILLIMKLHPVIVIHTEKI